MKAVGTLEAAQHDNALAGAERVVTDRAINVVLQLPAREPLARQRHRQGGRELAVDQTAIHEVVSLECAARDGTIGRRTRGLVIWKEIAWAVGLKPGLILH